MVPMPDCALHRHSLNLHPGFTQGKVTGLDVGSKRKAYESALKDHNRLQAEIKDISNDYNMRLTHAGRLKASVQEKVHLLSSIHTTDDLQNEK